MLLPSPAGSGPVEGQRGASSALRQRRAPSFIYLVFLPSPSSKGVVYVANVLKNSTWEP